MPQCRLKNKQQQQNTPQQKQQKIESFSENRKIVSVFQSKFVHVIDRFNWWIFILKIKRKQQLYAVISVAIASIQKKNGNSHTVFNLQLFLSTSC